MKSYYNSSQSSTTIEGAALSFLEDRYRAGLAVVLSPEHLGEGTFSQVVGAPCSLTYDDRVLG